MQLGGGGARPLRDADATAVVELTGAQDRERLPRPLTVHGPSLRFAGSTKPYQLQLPETWGRKTRWVGPRLGVSVRMEASRFLRPRSAGRPWGDAYRASDAGLAPHQHDGFSLTAQLATATTPATGSNAAGSG